MAAQRREVGDKLDTALAKIQELESKLSGKSKPRRQAKADKADTDVGALEKISEQLAALGGRLESLESSDKQRVADAARAQVMDEILKKVPEGNRKQARVIVRGLEADGLALTQDGAVEKAMAELQTLGALVDRSRGAPLRAPQIAPDGKPDFSNFAHPADIPREFLGQAMADPKQAERLLAAVVGTTTRETDGYNI